MSSPEYFLTITLPYHGEFKCELKRAERIDRDFTKAQLAKVCARVYEGVGDAQYATAKYWMGKPKFVLVAVVGDCTELLKDG